jgi:glucan phosphoethanolaminetransferase (alkaline phosphatase superfamily)
MFKSSNKLSLFTLCYIIGASLLDNLIIKLFFPAYEPTEDYVLPAMLLILITPLIFLVLMIILRIPQILKKRKWLAASFASFVIFLGIISIVFGLYLITDFTKNLITGRLIYYNAVKICGGEPIISVEDATFNTERKDYLYPHTPEYERLKYTIGMTGFINFTKDSYMCKDRSIPDPSSSR